MSYRQTRRILLGALVPLLVATIAALRLAHEVGAQTVAPGRTYLPVIRVAGGAVPPSPTPTPPPTPVPQPGATGLFLSTLEEYHLNSSLAVDAAGGLHLVFTGSGETPDGDSPAYYSYCPAPLSGCGERTAWSRVVLDEAAGEVQILLAPGGRPRVLISPLGDGRTVQPFRYLACDEACSNASSWSMTAVGATIANNLNASRELAQTFALDREGRPRFVYVDFRTEHAGTFLVACEAACHDPNAWDEVQIDHVQLDDLALALDDEGMPHLLGSVLDAEREPILIYTSFSREHSWQALTLGRHGAGDPHWSFRLDGKRPRIAFYQGVLPGGGGERLLYLSCEQNCATPDHWQVRDLGLGAGRGGFAALELDGQGRPRIAFAVGSGQGLGYAWCDTNCGAEQSVWHTTLLEAPQEAIRDMPAVPFCEQPVWIGGQMPTLALDATGRPRVAYEGELTGRCLINPNNPAEGRRTFTIFRGLRVIFPDSILQ